MMPRATIWALCLRRSLGGPSVRLPKDRTKRRKSSICCYAAEHKSDLTKTSYTFFKVPNAIRIAPIFNYLLYVTSAITTLLLLVVFINYFVRSADRAEADLKQANLRLSNKNIQIEETQKQRDIALAALDRELSEAADYVKTILPAPMNVMNVRTEWRFAPSASLGVMLLATIGWTANIWLYI
jgi:hypothetical protein